MKTYRAPTIWILQLFAAIAIAGSIVVSGIVRGVFPHVLSPHVILDPQTRMIIVVMSVLMGIPLYFLMSSAIGVSLLPDGKLRFLRVWFPRTIDGTRLTRITRLLRAPRSRAMLLDELTLHWPGGRQRLLIESSQVSAFLADIRALNPSVECTGFETVFSMTSEKLLAALPDAPVQIPIRSGLVRWSTFNAGSTVIAPVVVAVIFLAVSFAHPPGILVFGMGAIMVMAAVSSYLTYPEYRRYLLVPRALSLEPDHTLIAHIARRTERIPVSTIRFIIARRFWSKLWIELIYADGEETRSIYFSNVTLPDATTFIATLRALNPAITLDGFHGTP